MSDLAELEARIRASLDRIDAGIDRLPPRSDPRPDPQAAEEVARLTALLEAERALRAEAEAALAAVPAGQPAVASAEPRDDDRLLRQIDAQSLDNQRLRASVSALREEVRRLTEALVEGVAEPALINHAMAAELEALRAQRASETTEMADILAQLDRIVTEGELADA